MLVIGLLLFCWPIFGQAQSSNGQLANYFLKWQINDQEAQQLAKWDLLIMDMQNQLTSREALLKIRQLNPDVKILAYLSANEVQKIHAQAQEGNPWRDFYDYVDNNNLWLYDSNGQRVSFWSAALMVNITDQRWTDFVGQYLANNILNSDLWDGVYVDGSFSGIKWLNPQLNITDQEWQAGMRKLLINIRQYLNNQQVIIVNSSSVYTDLVNGRMYESWPNVYGGSWSSNYRDVIKQQNIYQKPTTVVINSNANNQNKPTSYRLLRYGLSSALLLDSYYSFDYGDQDHASLWWYDEYDQNLGLATNSATAQNGDYSIWSRDYEQGLVLLNTSNQPQEYELDGEYEKINGQQDQRVNNGEIVNSVTLPSQDGLILLRRILEVNGTSFRNGSFITAYQSGGQEKRAGFFAYDKGIAGGYKIIKKDLNKDQQLERVITQQNWWQIMSGEKVLTDKIYPFTNKYQGSINMIVADINNDQQDEIITAQNQGGSTIKIYSYQTRKELKSWQAFDAKFKGGVNIAVGDIDHNGWPEIVATPSSAGGPQIKYFNDRGRLLRPGVMIGDAKYRGGLQIAVGDFDGNKSDDLLVMKKQGNKILMQILNNKNQVTSSWTQQSKSDIDLLASDIDHDGRTEILFGTRDVFTW
ncbi:MAG: hypothetical protein CO133_01560 [Candidatus Komeilibacteria bacterium CG_4_9_14_3_um_filter_37_5]|nr:MAG: hypothetical protein CO133_01560 [Candidatus Komeilibacteria bacterium CG_4_9_14_3_um_filter_37_5]